MWATTYIMVALIAPTVSTTPAWIYAFLGAVMIFCVLVQYIATDNIGRFIAAIPLVLFGGLMTFGGVASWTAAGGYWNVPFANLELFHVSMAFANLISAVFLFYNAIALLKNDV